MKFTLKLDKNGNKILKVQPNKGRSFSIQTLGNLPITHKMTRDNIDPCKTMHEVAVFVAHFGTDQQKRSFESA